MATVEVYDCERKAQTVAAIKYVCQARGLRLAAAKDLIDEVYYRHRSFALDFGAGPEAIEFAGRMQALGFSCRMIVAGETTAEPAAAADPAAR